MDALPGESRVTSHELAVIDLGTVPYQPALELQRAVAAARISGALPCDVLLLVEHPPVVTLGRGTKAGNLVGSAALLKARGVELFEVERGGDVTYHGPGQLVGYPVFDLKTHRQDLHWYLRQVEEALILALATVGLPAVRNPGFTGVWTRGGPQRLGEPGKVTLGATERGSGDGPGPIGLRKIASIGVHAREWVTWHGFALNVTTDLTNFDLIVPCGIAGVAMTTVERELGADFPGPLTVKKAITAAFGTVFGRDLAPRTVAWLDAALSATSPVEGA
jgi:lipoyl(octanoyl) transferase